MVLSGDSCSRSQALDTRNSLDNQYRLSRTASGRERGKKDECTLAYRELEFIASARVHADDAHGILFERYMRTHMQSPPFKCDALFEFWSTNLPISTSSPPKKEVFALLNNEACGISAFFFFRNQERKGSTKRNQSTVEIFNTFPALHEFSCH